MSVVSHSGIARPYEEPEPYPAFADRAAALNGFRLTYLNSDHEITLIQVLPGGESTDLSPFADLQPSKIPDGRLSVLLQDVDPSGEEFGYYAAHSLLATPGARRYQIRDVGCVDDCVRRVPSSVFRDPFPGLTVAAGGVLLALVGFRMFFTGNRNHNLDRVGVWFEDDNIHVAMRDAGGGDTFAYLVDFIAIPTEFLNVSTGVEQGSGAQAFSTHPLPSVERTDFVVTGWELNFQRGDHKILDIGVIRGADSLTVFYGDSGGGDPFDWRVQWAEVGPRVFAPLNIV
jgi:hypothetical protein